jgi:hypothetical protein
MGVAAVRGQQRRGRRSGERAAAARARVGATSTIARLTSCAVVGLLALSSSGCGGGTGQGAGRGARQAEAPLPAPPTERDLALDWLDGEGRLTPARLERLLALAMAFPTSRRVVDEAVEALGVSGPRGLGDVVSVCEPGLADASGGRAVIEANTHVFSVDLPTLVAGRPSPAVEAHLREVTGDRRALRVKVEPGDDVYAVRLWYRPTFCVMPGLDLASALEVLTHELTHAARREPTWAGPAVSEHAGERAYLEWRVQRPGDEVDAYLVGMKVRRELQPERRLGFAPLERRVGAKGEPLAGRAELGRVILDAPPDGIGYATTSLRGAYDEALVDEHGEARTRLRVVESALEQRRRHMAVTEQNVAGFEHNVGVYRQGAAEVRARGDANEAAKLDAQAASEERARASEQATLAVLRASIARLEAERTRLRAWVARVEARRAALGG